MSEQPKILLIDKPLGRSSFNVVGLIRRLSGVKRVGHAGTLDPLATGLLIVLVGRESTRMQDSFLHLDKRYECTAELGRVSATYDAEGPISISATEQQLRQLTRKEVEEALKKFVGSYPQRVPAFSAVKKNGKKMYELARKGTVIAEDLPVKNVNIFSLTLQYFGWDEGNEHLSLSCSVHCGSGTYIRSLIHDLGQELGVGAYVTSLRRTTIGPYSVENAVHLEGLTSESVQRILDRHEHS